MLETFLNHEEELVTKELILFMKSIIENNCKQLANPVLQGL